FLRCFCQLYFTKTISDKQKATVSFPLLFVLSWGTFVSDSFLIHFLKWLGRKRLPCGIPLLIF
ncbi:hypothetical protein KB566_10125, partial [Streptococcus canis]|nr:hypothetical protein [Streptococcus canis]